MSLIHPPTEAIDQRVVAEPPPMWMRAICLIVYCLAVCVAYPILGLLWLICQICTIGKHAIGDAKDVIKLF